MKPDTVKPPLNVNARYPVQYSCTHCGNGPFRKSEGKPSGRDWLTCPTCRFGALQRMTWNGIAWH